MHLFVVREQPADLLLVLLTCEGAGAVHKRPAFFQQANGRRQKLSLQTRITPELLAGYMVAEGWSLAQGTTWSVQQYLVKAASWIWRPIR